MQCNEGFPRARGEYFVASKRSAIIRTFSGEMFDIVNPDPNKILLIDLAHHMALINRYTGASKVPYNDSQHSVLVSHLVPKGFELDGLFHDSPEAFMNDINRPLKQLLPEYRAIEDKLYSVIAKKFALSDPIPNEVHDADLLAYHVERYYLFNQSMPPGTDLFDIGITALNCINEIWGWERSQKEWLNRYHELVEGRFRRQ